MSEPARSRRLIALFAAYVVAFQALLLPLTVIAFAAPEASLCASGQGTSLPLANHDAVCPCAAGCGTQCCLPGLAGSSRAEIKLRPALVSVITLTPSLTRVISHVDRGSHAPRAPPSA